MVARKKYRDPCATSLRTEKWKRQIIHDILKLSDAEVYSQGADKILGLVIQGGRVSSQVLTRLLQYHQDQAREHLEKVTTIQSILAGKHSIELKETITLQKKEDAIRQVLGDGSDHIRKLPAHDLEAIYEEWWEEREKEISKLCGESIDRMTLINYVKKAQAKAETSQ